MPKLVLAEDDETMVRLLSALLRMEGFDVEVPAADEDLVTTVERTGPDVLLLDVMLPKRSGLDVLDDLRRSPRWSDLCVIMFSGLSLKDECLSHGANDFLLKPFMPEELIGMLRKCLQRPS